MRPGIPVETAPTLFDAAQSPDAPEIDERPLRPEAPPRWRYEPEPEAPAEVLESFNEPERPRVAMLPVAFGVILGLLIGFAGGYAVGGRDNTGQSPSAAANPAPPPTIPPQPAAPPQRSGRAWSEQAIAQPTTPPAASGRTGTPATAPPPVPGDAPATGKAAPAPRPTRATLTVESTPKNAAVTVNGKWRGRTPLTIDDLAFGTHTLRIVQPGYAVARQVVTLTKSEPSRTLSFRLQRPGAAAAASPQPPAPRSPAVSTPRNPSATTTRDKFSGSLFVASNPPGARVFVDGRPFGTAPARIPEIPIGSHVVRLELPDHRIWSTSTRVAAGQETRVTGSLERIQ
jgi:hypothetical protein